VFVPAEKSASIRPDNASITLPCIRIKGIASTGNALIHLPDHDPQCRTPEGPRCRMSNGISTCSSQSRMQKLHAVLTGSHGASGGVGQSNVAEIIFTGARGSHASWTACKLSRWRMHGSPGESHPPPNPQHTRAYLCRTSKCLFVDKAQRAPALEGAVTTWLPWRVSSSPKMDGRQQEKAKTKKKPAERRFCVRPRLGRNGATAVDAA
jgi:hypothetical protein